MERKNIKRKRINQRENVIPFVYKNKLKNKLVERKML